MTNPMEPYKDLLLHSLLSTLGGDQLELMGPALRLGKCVVSMLSGNDVRGRHSCTLPIHFALLPCLAGVIFAVCVQRGYEYQ